jgi:DNA polymerase-4
LDTHWEPILFSREHTYKQDVGNWQTIAKIIAELTQEVVSDLARKGYYARTVTLKIRYQDFRTVTRACSSNDPIKKEEEIRRLAFSCLQRIGIAGKKIRLVGVRVGNLEKIGNACLPTENTHDDLFSV